MPAVPEDVAAARSGAAANGWLTVPEEGAHHIRLFFSAGRPSGVLSNLGRKGSSTRCRQCWVPAADTGLDRSGGAEQLLGPLGIQLQTGGQILQV